MEKRFIIQTIRSFLIPIVICVLAGFAIFYASAVNCTFHNVIYSNNPGYRSSYRADSLTPSLIAFLCYFITWALILPVASYSYRYKRKGADMYFQSPLPQNFIRQVRALVPLALLLIAYTLLFFLLTTWCYIKVTYGAVPEFKDPSTFVERLPLSYGRILLVYVVSFGVITVTYGASCLCCNFTGSKAGAILNIFSFQVFSNGIIYAIALILNRFIKEFGTTFHDNFGTFSFGSMHGYTLATQSVFYLTYGTSDWYNPDKNGCFTLTIVCLCVFVLFGIAGFLSLFFDKEISGEYAGRTNDKRFISLIAIHCALLTGAIALCAVPSGVMVLPQAISFAIFYFVMLVIHEGNVRFAKKVWIPALVIVVALLITSITFSVLPKEVIIY